MKSGWKEFHLTAEPVQRELATLSGARRKPLALRTDICCDHVATLLSTSCKDRAPQAVRMVFDKFHISASPDGGRRSRCARDEIREKGSEHKALDVQDTLQAGLKNPWTSHRGPRPFASASSNGSNQDQSCLLTQGTVPTLLGLPPCRNGANGKYLTKWFLVVQPKDPAHHRQCDRDFVFWMVRLCHRSPTSSTTSSMPIDNVAPSKGFEHGTVEASPSSTSSRYGLGHRVQDTTSEISDH